MTLLVKNVYIVGGPMEGRSDVYVLGDTISAVGNFPTKQADVTVDGQGANLMPGFIDVHGESDHHWSLLAHRSQAELLAQGITTVIWGHEGVSIAPYFGEGKDVFEGWLDPERMNVGWERLSDAFALFGKKPLGVNFATLAGHNLIRAGILGRKRSWNKRDTMRWRECARAALASGALGLSLSPRTLALAADGKEIRLVQAAVRAADGVFAFGAAAGFDPALVPALLAGKGRKLWTTFDALPPKELKGALAAIEADPEARFEVSPFEGDLRPLYSFLPEWAWKEDVRTTARQFKDEWAMGRILKELPLIDPDEWWLVKAERQPALVGRSLRELMAIFELPRSAALLRVLKDTGLLGLALHRRGDTRTRAKLLAHPQAFIGSHGAAVPPETRGHMAEIVHDVATFPEYLSRASTKRADTLLKAVDRITRAPAEFFRIPRRGRIQEGYFADLVGMKEGKVAFTIVNGRVAWKDGELAHADAGRPLLSSIPKKNA